ncbi:two-component hybrid sensor and regulator [Nostoc sp. NIES-4103]|nr:two-component hybrid sensor and regulator [Nostoc sp. NIES-4103]
MTLSSNSLPGYQLSELLYESSKTLVYRGKREIDDLPVAIKLLKSFYPTFTELVQFRNQYTIAKNFQIPGIIQIYCLESYHNSYALVMEYFGGISLAEYTVTHKLELKEFLSIALQLTEILENLYLYKIIHKDIKPANILIHPDTKQIKLIDFSIASLLPRETQSIQNPGVLEGTLAYLAPEQTGRMNRGIDYRADFYALGATFFELLTGQLPFSSDDPMELVHYHIAKEPPLVCAVNLDIPLALAQIIKKLLAKNAEDRYQSASGLKYDLEICLNQLQNSGTIQEFKIGQRDLCEQFLIPEKLYGRENEVQQLISAFEHVSHGFSELILVAGFSGIGKTAVVNEVHKPIVKQRGYFIKGKFDQFNRNVPFSGFVQAFRDLMMQLLTESDQQLQHWKSKILKAVAENGQVLIEVIPELEQIIGQQSPLAELSGAAAQNRFNLIFQKFIQVFTTKEHPLVIFLDDLQWADSGSLQLMQLLMSESGQSYLLLIGAYRDNEVSLVHPLILTLDKISELTGRVNSINLLPLSLFSLNKLVADTLGCVENTAQNLSKLVYKKTKGNPFFTTQLLRKLHQDGLIEFNFQERCWQCDIAQVKQQTLTDDIVKFMVSQLTMLPQATQDVLQLAACIGNQFDLATLAIISKRSQIETATCLWKALQSGLILPLNENYKFYVGQEHQAVTSKTSEIVAYKFLHDRVQQAAYSLIPEQERSLVHYQIGKLLLQQFSPDAIKEKIFAVVNQLNYGIELITDQTERDAIAELNLLACRRAKTSTAYRAAYEYATIGLNLMESKAWQRHYQMSLTFHELATAVASLCGEFDQMNQWIDIVIHHAKTPLDQVGVYIVKIQALTSQNQLLEAISSGQAILKELGVQFPEHPTVEYIQQGVQEINSLLGERSIEELFDLKPMVDAEKLATIQIAASIMTACYVTGSPVFPLLNILQVNLSLQYGNSPNSAYSYACYGVFLNIFLQNVTAATQFGRLAYRLALEADAKNIRPETFIPIALFLHHRQSHLQEALPISQQGYQAGLETGKLKDAAQNANIFCLNSYWCGQLLVELETQIFAYHQQLLNLNQLTAANYCSIYWETTLFLLGNPDKIEISFENTLNEEKLISQALLSNDLWRIFIFSVHRAMLKFLLGDIDGASTDALRARKYIAAGAGTIAEAGLNFYDSLIILASVPNSQAELETQQQRVQENQARLQYWAEYAPMNYLHKWQLIEAEHYRILGQKIEAIELYDRSISLAKENGYIQEQAIANEVAAKFYLEWGKEKIAQAYMQEAYYCYARWGAKAKTDDLEKLYPHLLQPILQQQKLNTIEAINSLANTSNQNYTLTSSTNSTIISDALDFASVLKAAQIISSNIQLDELITSFTKIILENAGAKKCVLILSHQGQWQVRAITSMNNQDNLTTKIVDSLPLDACEEVPVKLIQYVKRTLGTVVIDNCQTEINGVIDDYLLQYQPQSALCTPILNQGNLVGIVYLENSLIQGVFTSERLVMINLLCSQVSISLENARLYQQAQETQLQLVQNEKMSALGNLVAGVAHEMNNPLGFIFSSLKQAKPNFSDLIEHLEYYRQRFPNPGDDIIMHGEEIEIDYLLEDLPQMLSSMEVACEHLSNISTSLRIFSRADLEYKVACNIHEGIDSTILILKHRLKANEHRPAIEIITNYGKLPLVECFPGQLNQVFMNLLANAIDALEESNYQRSYQEIKTQPNCIKIETYLQENYAKISIADNGKGMTEEVKNKIFDHSFTTKGVGKGTGLGLAIARQIVVEKHNGTIQVNSSLGEGSEFIITLPVKAKASPTAMPKTSSTILDFGF